MTSILTLFVLVAVPAAQALGQSSPPPVCGSYFDAQVFDARDYVDRCRASGIGSVDSWTLAELRMHWINRGMAAGWPGSRGFDPVEYISTCPDLRPVFAHRWPIAAASDGDWPGAIKHYLTHGIAEGRSPSRGRPPGLPRWDTGAFWPTNSLDGNAITGGDSGGFPITVASESAYAGAISSLQWKGREFISTAAPGSKGYLLQFAYQLDGMGECYNPTEAGSLHDWSRPTTTSRCKLFWGASTSGSAPATMVTMVQPAYWLSAAGNDPEDAPARNNCLGHTAIGNGTDLFAANHLITKRVTIEPEVGGARFGDVVEILSDITIADRSVRSLRFEAPTGHLAGFFSDFYLYKPGSGAPIPVGNGGHQSLPLIYASHDGGFAMGVLSPDLPRDDEWEPGYQLSYYAPPTPDADPTSPRSLTTSKWSLVYRPAPNAEGIYTFRTYLVIGTRASVPATMDRLAVALRYAPAPWDRIVDDADAGEFRANDGAGRWSTFRSQDIRHMPYGGSLRYAPTSGSEATWRFTGLRTGTYKVQVGLIHASNLEAMSAPFAGRLGVVRYTLYDGPKAVASFAIDQNRPVSFTSDDSDRPSSSPYIYYIADTQFQSIGLVAVASGMLRVVATADEAASLRDTYLIADAIRIVPKVPPPAPSLEPIPTTNRAPE